MFRIKNILPFSLALLVTIFGCEPEPVIFKGPYHVRFTENSAFERESFSKVINIELHNAGPALSEDLEITYTVGGNAREGVDFIILGDRGHAVIKAGEYFGTVQIQLINNSNNILRSQNIIFTLRSVNNNEVQVGQGESGIGNTFTFTIFDDCILGGHYIGDRGGFSVPVEGITITSEDCENYLLSNWNVNIFNTPFDMDLTFIDKGDNTLIIPLQEEDALPEDLATIMGTGIVDPITRKINMTITLVDFDGEEVSFTLIPD
jgi:hypothetical protein